MMNSRSKSSEDQAASWAARLDGGTLSAKEARQLEAWLNASPAHEPLLQEILSLQGEVGAEIRAMVVTEQLAQSDNPVKTILHRGWTWAAVAAAASLALIFFWPETAPQELTTVAAQRESVTLEDTTQVDLNAHTTLAVKMSGKERFVRLANGEAYFNVAKEASRPFRVETPAGVILVTGTAFNVRMDPSGTMEVTVLEGTVRVRAGAEELSLKPAEQLWFDGTQPRVRGLDESSRSDVIAWRRGRIVFDQTPIRTALEQFARYHDRPISVDASAEGLRLGGQFKLDNFDGFLRDLELVLPVTVLRTDKSGSVRVLRR